MRDGIIKVVPIKFGMAAQIDTDRSILCKKKVSITPAPAPPKLHFW
jgi:hypothetical protein